MVEYHQNHIAARGIGAFIYGLFQEHLIRCERDEGAGCGVLSKTLPAPPKTNMEAPLPGDGLRTFPDMFSDWAEAMRSRSGTLCPPAGEHNESSDSNLFRCRPTAREAGGQGRAEV